MLLNKILLVIASVVNPSISSIRSRGISSSLCEIFTTFHLRDDKYNLKPILVRLDLSKAFTRVDNEYVKFLLPKYIDDNSTTNAIVSLLMNKTLVVSIDGRFNNFKKVTSGILQGSSLSSEIFVLYLHALLLSIESSIVGLKLENMEVRVKSSIYVDDLTFFHY